MRGLVLAGGRGERMGKEKAWIIHPDGRSLLVRAVDLLREAGCDGVTVALRKGQDLRGKAMDGLDIAWDTGDGPLGGMIAAMEKYDTDWLVIACDLPRLEAAVLRKLVGFPDIFVVYGTADQLEPLCGYYGSSALGILRKSRDQGELGLQKILRMNGAKVLATEDKRALENANTMAEWESSLKG